MNWALCNYKVKKCFSKLAYIGIAWRVSSGKSAGLPSRVSDSGGQRWGPGICYLTNYQGILRLLVGDRTWETTGLDYRSRSLSNVTHVAQGSVLAFLICLH